MLRKCLEIINLSLELLDKLVSSNAFVVFLILLNFFVYGYVIYTFIFDMIGHVFIHFNGSV